VDIERDGDDQEVEDEEEEDEKKEDEEGKEEEDEDEEEDDDKEPRTIGQGEIVITSRDEVDTMVDDQPIVLPEQGKEMLEHTLRPQPPAPASLPQRPDPPPQPRTR
jgi:hypothetical protein